MADTTSRRPAQRAVANPAKAGRGGRTAAPEQADETTGGKTGKKKKLIAIVAVLAVVAAAAVYFFVLPKKASAAEAAPKPGTVVALESTSLNLAGGHYLRIGIALQLTEEGSAGGHGASDGPDGSQAKDLIIATFSGKKIETLNNAKEREALKQELAKKIGEAYHHDVMDIYFTEFVTQ